MQSEEIRELCNRIILERDPARVIPLISNLRTLLAQEIVELDLNPESASESVMEIAPPEGPGL